MITKDFLSNCSDEQINKGVAWLECSDEFLGGYIINGEYCPGLYCANPGLSMPIAFANGISLGPALEDEWVARLNGFIRYNTNPLRAICEVYLLMECAK